MISSKFFKPAIIAVSTKANCWISFSLVCEKKKLRSAPLSTAFRNARKALATAQIDKALAAGSITADEAAVLKAKLAAATLPGYKPGVGLGLGGYGHP